MVPISNRSILILSGGLDSTVSAYLARNETQPILALTFDYGQRATRRESEAAGKIAARLGVPHKIFPLPWLAEITKTALVNRNTDLPQMKDLDDTNEGKRSASTVWVPNRNGLFLNIAASFAEALEADLIVTGFNKEEGATFPDNSPPFVESANLFFSYATLKRVKVTSFTLDWTKTEIAKKGKELGIPFEEIWFCYEGGEKSCGLCESCLRSRRAFERANINYDWEK